MSRFIFIDMSEATMAYRHWHVKSGWDHIHSDQTHTHIYRIISKFSCQYIENIFLIIYLEELINLNRYIYIMDFADIYIYISR